MNKPFFSWLAAALLLAGTAHAQAPAAEVQALTQQLNQLMRIPKSDDNGEVMVSLANCGVQQTVRKYRTPDETSGSLNVNVSSSKKGGSWAVKSNSNVQFELTLALDWTEVGSISYAAQQDEKEGRRYYDVTLLRRSPASGKSSSGLTDSITLSLHTQNKQEVEALVRRLHTLRRQCVGQKS